MNGKLIPIARAIALAEGAAKMTKAELGIGKAPVEVTAERRKICEGCDKWNHGRCMACGCYTWAKTVLTREKCPLDKWPKVEG